MIRKVIRALKAHVDECRLYKQKKQAEEIEAEYEITENNGHIYLLHRGYAIRRFAPEESVSEVIGAIKDARKARLVFAGLMKAEKKTETKVLSFSKIGIL